MMTDETVEFKGVCCTSQWCHIMFLKLKDKILFVCFECLDWYIGSQEYHKMSLLDINGRL